jgi:conjugal transfer pilus assembly protein TraD
MLLLAPIISEAIHALLALVLACALGIVGGRLAPGLMRESGLHWSWALVGLAVVSLLFVHLGDWGPTLIILAFTAARRGRRRHGQDLQSGGEGAASARALLTPLALLRALGARASRVSLQSKPGVPPAAGVLLGVDETGAEARVPLGPGLAPVHTLIVGATGSGKTVTQSVLLAAAIRSGSAAVVIDPKGDGTLYEAARGSASAVGREFLEWTPSGAMTYNPYGRGSETEIADRVLAGERYTEPHYLRLAQRYLGHAIRTLRASATAVSLAAIAEHLDPNRLELLARELPDHADSRTLAYLDALTPRQRVDLAGVRDRISILTESDVGKWLEPGRDGVPEIELQNALRAGAVIYFGLRSDSRPLLSQMLGAAIVQDLQSTVSAQQGRPLATLVAIDEFSALAATQVVALFGRARSAGFSLLLATQELADLRLPGSERMLEQVLGNLSLLIAHRQVLPASAQLLAELAGTRETWRVAHHGDGRTTRTQGEEPALAADRLAALRPGQAALFTLSEGRGARIVQVALP